MDTPVHPAFTSLAYALILFRQAGYPCVFYGDMYGTSEPFPSPPTCSRRLADLLLARKLYAHGEQRDYFSGAKCIGWVRMGLPASDGRQTTGMAVVMSWVGNGVETPHLEQSSARRPSWLRWLSSLSINFGKAKGSSHLYQKRMNVGTQHAGEVWTDILGGSLDKVIIAHSGYGVFPCRRNSVAIYVSESAKGREQFPVNFEANL
jgi:alpha-amylase